MAGTPYDRKVREFLSKDVIWTEPDDTVADALSMMIDHKVSALVVRNGGDCVGMLSATDLITRSRDLVDVLSEIDAVEGPGPDILVRLAENDVGRRKVGEVMARDLATVASEAPLLQAAHEMLRHRVHRLPVIDEKKNLVGVVSTMDIVQAFVDGAPRS